MAALTENADPNLSIASGGGGVGGMSPAAKPAAASVIGGGGRPPRKNRGGLRVSISPKVAGGRGGGAAARTRRGNNRRRSSSHFGSSKKLVLADSDDDDDDDEDEDDDDDDDSDIEFTLDGAEVVSGAGTKESAVASASAAVAEEEEEEEEVALTPSKRNNNDKVREKAKQQQKKQQRRRRSSARFLRLSAGGGGNNSPMRGDSADDDVEGGAASSEHLGEIYRHAIQMNAENRINASNSWGLRLIENMDKFINEDNNHNHSEGGGGGNDHLATTPRGDEAAREELRAARKMKSKDGRGRVNFTKASCTLDASVKIYSYRVDDVHLSSYRVLANLNRTDAGSGNKKDGGATDVDGDGAGGTEGGVGGERAKRRTGPRGPTETLEANMANINMSKLDSAYDIDPLFHKMSKSFDEGGAKGLLLGNLGVSQNGCHVVFDSNEEDARGEVKMDKIDEEGGGDNEKEGCNDDGEEEEEKFDIDPEEATVWKESDIDIANLSAKLSSMLASSGHRSTSSVPFVPQLESLRSDYVALEEEGYAVDENATDGRMGTRRRLKLYDAPEEEEKEAERSIHVIAMERSRGSVLGMSFDTNFRLSMGDIGDDDAGGGDFDAEDFGGEGEFAPPEDVGFGGGDGEFAPDFGGDGDGGGGFDVGDGDDIQPGTFVDPRSYNNTKVLLDALCSGDAFYEGNVGGNNGNGDYAFFDMKKFEKATDGNLWAGSQHWKKRPELAKKDKKKAGERRRVMFDDDDSYGEGEGKKKRRAIKKDRVFVDFREAPDVDAIFARKKTARRAKKSRKDPYQMRKTEKDFLLPPDAGVDISQLSKLFSRPNAIVRRGDGNGVDKPLGKTVGFHDIGENPLGFDDGDDDFGGGDDDGGGFAFEYGGDDDGNAGGAVGDDVDYNVDKFDKVRKVEKIDIGYATVAKKVDVRRLKRDLWAELEEGTARVKAEDVAEDALATEAESGDEEKKHDADEIKFEGESEIVSFKETVEKMETTQGQSDVTISFYFICCLHLANEKGLRLDSTGLEDFVISLDDGSAPEFGTAFGDGFTETANKLSSGGVAGSRGKRETKKVTTYAEDDEEEEAEGIEDVEEE